MSTLKEDLETVHKWAPEWGALGALCMLTLVVSFFVPAVQESLLGLVSEGAFSWGLMLQVSLLVAMAGSFAMVSFRLNRAGLPANPVPWAYLSCLCAAFASTIAIGMSNYAVVVESSIAKARVERVEKRLGRPIPLGDELRVVMSSFSSLMEGRSVVDEVLRAREHPSEVMEILSVSPVLGQDHPVIQFAIENGMAQEESRTILYRDMIERMRENPSLALDTEVQRALSVLATSK